MSKAIYKQHLGEREQHGERNDCSIRAVAAATGAEYADVLAYINSLGRRKGTRTKREYTEQALEHFIGKGNKVVTLTRDQLDCATLGQVEKVLAGTEHSPVVVMVRGHAAAIVNGACADWASEHQHRVQSIYVVTSKRAKSPKLPAGVLAGTTPESRPGIKAKGDYSRPKSTSKCGQLWAYLDEQLAAGNEEVSESKGYTEPGYEKLCAKLGVSIHTAKAQHFRWRKVQ